MRWRHVQVGLVAAFGFAQGAGLGYAEENTGFGVERWRWSQNADGILDVESGQVGKHREFTLGAWVGYSNDPLLAYAIVSGERERLGALIHHRVGGAFVGSLALWNRLELGAEIPMIWYQQRAANFAGTIEPLGNVRTLGLGDLRLRPKLALLRQAKHGVDVGIIAGFSLPTGRGRNYFGDAGLTFVPELALTRRWARVRAAMNLGYRARRNQTTVDLNVGDEVSGRVGLAWAMTQTTTERWVELGVTVSGAVNAAEFTNSKFNQTPLEANVGLTLPLRNVDVLVATGLGLHEGYGSPDWRALVGLRYHRSGTTPVKNAACAMGPEDFDGFEDADGCADPDNDRDGVLDVVDKAPDKPEDKDGYEDGDGAPDPDSDQDGLDDAVDKCPSDAETINGYLDSDGCPDTGDGDADGIEDKVDKCPAEAEDKDGYADEDGCPEDNDEDGIADVQDRCPNKPGPEANQGCPDMDSDGDGVVDRVDNCPAESGLEINAGCKAKQLVALVAGKIEILDLVYFKTNRDIIQERSYKLLENVASVILAHPELTQIEVAGHTDDRGEDAYNLDLSQRRAQAVVNFLIEKGVRAEQLVAKGYGETKPVASNTTDMGRSSNRRVEFHVVGIAVRNEGPQGTLDGE